MQSSKSNRRRARLDVDARRDIEDELGVKKIWFLKIFLIPTF